MWKLRRIKVLHIEPTDVCQAAWPLCARETDPLFNKSVKHHLEELEALKLICEVYAKQDISNVKIIDDAGDH